MLIIIVIVSIISIDMITNTNYLKNYNMPKKNGYYKKLNNLCW